MEKNEVAVTKKEPNYRGVKAMPFVIGNETFEKLGTIGTSSNMLVYLSTVFNMSSISATNFINILNGTCNFGTMFGAFLSDTYLGRYKTLGIASISSNLGMLVLTLTAAFPSLHPPKCGAEESNRCVSATPWQLAFLFSAFGLLVVGASGIRPCNLAFGADQFNPNTDSGKKGVNSFFNWYFFTITFAQMVSVTLVVYVQTDVSWSIGLAIPSIFMFLSCLLFFMGTKIYVKVKPEGSPFTSILQVLVVAFKKRRLKLPQQPRLSLFNYTPMNSINSKLPHTDQLSFLDKAAVLTEVDEINPDGSAANPWRLCSMQQVEETKCVLRVIPVSLTAILYHIGAQQQYIVFQALQSNRHLGKTSFQIPAATYIIFAMLSLSIFIPIYDRILVPLMQRITGKEGGITVLQRMGIGIFITIIESFLGAFVEVRRRDLALKNPIPGVRGAISPMSALWLVPQLALGGLAEAFNSIGQVEFYYKQFPENMRSVAGAFFFVGSAVSNYLYGFIISVVHHSTEGTSGGNWLPEDLNKGRLDYFYYLTGALCFFNFCYFLACATWYRYKGSEDSNIALEMQEKKLAQHSA
ncbi:protein NRT1/ PTR FAMILY 2.11-like [Olea europaea var. sylvestris]|uniref:protein NRT1/ PTR FAMILY 2.11-like n=1 Tax=Olea europaea var. sylvestris TaxID=158386 RepID=UPI000C1D443B|nr:protein NRT1/ PTR FAMILY 2.11-like [Olea europaea var. sylvestris]